MEADRPAASGRSPARLQVRMQMQREFRCCLSRRLRFSSSEEQLPWSAWHEGSPDTQPSEPGQDSPRYVGAQAALCAAVAVGCSWSGSVLEFRQEVKARLRGRAPGCVRGVITLRHPESKRGEGKWDGDSDPGRTSAGMWKGHQRDGWGEEKWASLRNWPLVTGDTAGHRMSRGRACS